MAIQQNVKIQNKQTSKLNKTKRKPRQKSHLKDKESILFLPTIPEYGACPWLWLIYPVALNGKNLAISHILK